MTKLLTAAVLAAVLAGCGGGRLLILYRWEGTVSGLNCLAPVVETMPVRYSVTIDDLAPGSGVSLVDQFGETWTGTMTTASSFRVTRTDGDPQRSIVGSEVTPTSVRIVATTGCVSFRCCTPLTGELRS
jgi:hypothetical protein